ncbi:transposable element tc3 transposase [Fusarium mundagurra]|uniref:Transposable element tc3 transposase n=1 Tax=Fusarium mundagurra TaxID=1567541 RepID=A0A8H6D1M3_9HYPO|nr:transposable element tc3 transposase [Fusarium mundagurra]
MRDLLDSVDNVIKKRSLRYLLREMNKRKWMQKKRVALTPLQARKRLDWAIRYQGINWRRVKWSDECMVRRGQGMRPTWTFLSPREALRVQDVQEARRIGVIRQMFWAAFGHGSRTPLVPLVGNVNAIGIYELYSFILPWFLQPGDIFMHDNASVHTARIVKALLQELEVDLMDWPPYSPDLNPIENLWALMKAEIYRLHPELTHAEDTVATQHALVLAAMEAWDNLEDRVLKNLCETMPNRIKARLWDFLNQRLNLASSQRARLSIHPHAQGKAEGVDKRQEEAQKKADEEASPGDAVKTAEEISDVRLYKARLAAGSGARRVRDISEYEDTAAKL